MKKSGDAVRPSCWLHCRSAVDASSRSAVLASGRTLWAGLMRIRETASPLSNTRHTVASGLTTKVEIGRHAA
jgi:hypothetical protein